MSNRTKGIEKVYVVSHTHWDREWYQDFQGFRTRLVYMMDELIEHMEQDAEYRYFTMDGQTIMLDDYLEIRPENRGRLQKLIQENRIAIGPWYVMPDEFLVSGESLIRNLLKGMRQARAWGARPMMSGFVTDIFGHNSQLPQILRGVGIDNAVLFRGFHGDADPAEMWWEGADGSRVLGLKLDEDRSYSDYYFALRWPFFDRDNAYDEHKVELFERAQKWMAYKNERATTTIALGMDGVDHIEIEPQLSRMLEMLNENKKLGVQFVHSHLETYLRDLSEKVGNLRVYKGEQKELAYNGLNNWVPENTLSSRVHLKQSNQLCENLLEKWTEPLGVIAALEGRPYSKSFIAKSWEFLLQNHPHDSICGCSIDQVHKDMIYRFDQSRLISEQMIQEQMSFISNHLNPELLNGNHAITVFNPSQSIIDGVIEVELALPANTDAAIMMNNSLNGTSFRIYDDEHREVPYQVVAVHKNSLDRYRPYRELPREERVDRFRIAMMASVPSFGYSVYRLERYTIENHAPLEYSAPKLVAPVRYPGSMQTDENTWDNGRIRLRVRTNGTIEIQDNQTGRTHEGLLLFEDEADIGDGWSHIAPVHNEIIRSLGVQATIATEFDGRYQTRIRIEINLRVPKGIEHDETSRSGEFIEIPIMTFIDLKKNDPVVYCRTVVRNAARDHRLRLLFPTGLGAEHYYTSTPFDLVKREIQRPDRTDYLRKDFEVAPHNGIVSVDDGQYGLAIYSKGLYEVAVRDNKQRTIALTLFRSTRKEVLTGGGDGGQLLRELEFSYAIRPFAAEETHPAQLWREHQHYVTGIRFMNRKQRKRYRETPEKRVQDLPLSRSYVNLDSNNLIVSAFKASEDQDNAYIIRFLNVSEEEGQGVVSFERELASVQLVNLDEEFLSELPFTKKDFVITAKAKQIVTVKLSFQ
ncbi:alpha-mannosidase [Paenibacillus mendelii]|uniref:Alpha-mannosidase n=1 Tax=Paenibacillus mendelii TaxID=206163 RepID=A0ABV6J6V5_9BACL|nr:glycoside hydrolase family 38 C-terminal domain-containing protein [Paenibacillus mendelii]MCQ6561011.1 glycosyl hydrolase-related protein [Paenibacillus mendelii]